MLSKAHGLMNSLVMVYHTTSRTSTKETSVSLAFCVEAMIPLEMGVLSYRTSHFNEEHNEKALHAELNLLERKRNEFELWTVVYKKKCQILQPKSMDKEVFEVGDLVLRGVFIATRELNTGSLGLNREGPYKITKIPIQRIL